MDRAGRMAHDDPRAFFAEHGWLVVRAAVPPSRVRELEAAVEAIYDAHPAVLPGQVWEAAGISRISAPIAEHTRDPAVARHAAAALGCPRVQLLQDTVLVKAARIGGAVA